MIRGTFTLTLFLMLPVAAIGKEPDISGHWTGLFHSNHVHLAPFTADIDISTNPVPQLLGRNPGRHLGQLKHGSDPSRCLAAGEGVNLQIDRQGSKLVMAGATAKGDTVTLVGVLNPSGTAATFNYVTNGGASGQCESDSGTVSLVKK